MSIKRSSCLENRLLAEFETTGGSIELYAGSPPVSPYVKIKDEHKGLSWMQLYMKKELPQAHEDQVIFSGPTTILIAPDGTKTIVKCSKDDTFSPSYGYLLCKYMQSSGKTRTQVSKQLRKVEKIAELRTK